MLYWSKTSSEPSPDFASAWRVRAEAIAMQAAEIDALLEIDGASGPSAMIGRVQS